MANSKYEYVKDFEFKDKIMHPNIIVARIDGRNFRRFSEVHKFDQPNDKKALELMNSCATAVMEKYPDIVFSYGFSDEYSFVFKKECKFYERRESKILSLLVSLFTSMYTLKWKEFFPQQELLYSPSFQAQIIRCPTIDVLQTYLHWRQNECHVNNLFHTCFWKLVESGMNETLAREILKGSQKGAKNELLFKQFGLNYKTLNPLFRQGTCLLYAKVQVFCKFDENGDAVNRPQRKLEIRYENIARKSFWDKNLSLVEQLGRFEDEIPKIRPEYVESFQFQDKLLLSTWIVVRIDGCHFHKFSDSHEFEKPNDVSALNLMNSCAAAVVEEFQDIVFGYGVSDEYSFVLTRDSKFYQRHSSRIVSVIVSLFSATYIKKWKEFFPSKELRYTPSFDGRAVCYPSSKILRDYLSWRQVDCHINNQYNTCFWMLVKSGKGKKEAQNHLKGTLTQDKNSMLVQYGIDYNAQPEIFRFGSCVFRDEIRKPDCDEGLTKRVVIEHSNIIDDDFWEAHSWILIDKYS
ncbi:hypothetical protein vseg_009007 [Gypsophila vaccaria]